MGEEKGWQHLRVAHASRVLVALLQRDELSFNGAIAGWGARFEKSSRPRKAFASTRDACATWTCLR